MKHVVTTDCVRITCESVGLEVYVRVAELGELEPDVYPPRELIFCLNAGEMEAVLCALAAARLDSQLRDRGV
jgi:hypothetical protein